MINNSKLKYNFSILFCFGFGKDDDRGKTKIVKNGHDSGEY